MFLCTKFIIVRWVVNQTNLSMQPGNFVPAAPADANEAIIPWRRCNDWPLGRWLPRTRSSSPRRSTEDEDGRRVPVPLMLRPTNYSYHLGKFHHDLTATEAWNHGFYREIIPTWPNYSG